MVCREVILHVCRPVVRSLGRGALSTGCVEGDIWTCMCEQGYRDVSVCGCTRVRGRWMSGNE